ncbi:hypothetical protein D3C87_618450 [compost metagenome]
MTASVSSYFSTSNSPAALVATPGSSRAEGGKVATHDKGAASIMQATLDCWGSFRNQGNDTAGRQPIQIGIGSRPFEQRRRRQFRTLHVGVGHGKAWVQFTQRLIGAYRSKAPSKNINRQPKWNGPYTGDCIAIHWNESRNPRTSQISKSEELRFLLNNK